MAASRPTGRRLARPGVPSVSKRALAQAAARVLRWEGRWATGTRVDITLLDAPAMRRLNRRATGRRGLTDVIAYTLPLSDGSLVGDIYICPAAAVAWSGTNPMAARVELVRLVVHGTLHVLGYDHPDGTGRTRSSMWKRQERYVSRLTGGKSGRSRAA